MQLRRHQNILAVRPTPEAPPVAFHAANLTVAEISEEAWNALPNITLSTSAAPLAIAQGEAGNELQSWSHYNDPETQNQDLRFGIRSLTLNVTQICNLHCTYCAAGGDGTYGDPTTKIAIEKTLPQIKFFLEQRAPGESFHIAFLGGEPLLYPDAIAAIGQYTLKLAKERKLHASFKVTTNGTLINAATLEALKSIRAHIVVSLDGPEAVHDLQRKTKSGGGSFSQVMKGLSTLMHNKSDLGSLGVHAVFNEHNLDVEKSWDFLSMLDVDYMEFTYSVSKPDLAASRQFNDSLERAAAKAWARGGEKELLRISNFRSVFDRLDRKERLENHCGMGKSMVVVDSRNRLWTCPWKVGSAKDRLGEGVDLDYDALAGHQKSVIARNNCNDCWAKFLCGGGCSFIHETTGQGDALRKKIDFCERTRFMMGLALVYYHQARSVEAG